MPRTEKPSAHALTGRKETAKRSHSQEWQSHSIAGRCCGIQQEHTMQAIKINGVEFKRVMPERCVRLTQWGKGQQITCRCTPCAARNQTPEQAKASVDAAHGFA